MLTSVTGTKRLVRAQECACSPRCAGSPTSPGPPRCQRDPVPRSCEVRGRGPQCTSSRSEGSGRRSGSECRGASCFCCFWKHWQQSWSAEAAEKLTHRWSGDGSALFKGVTRSGAARQTWGCTWTVLKALMDIDAHSQRELPAAWQEFVPWRDAVSHTPNLQCFP